MGYREQNGRMNGWIEERTTGNKIRNCVFASSSSSSFFLIYARTTTKF
jgi:hypothetical protein